MLLANSEAIAKIAAKNRLPAIGRPAFADAGGMLGFGPDRHAGWQRAAYFVDRILKGAKPADLPLEEPTILAFENAIDVSRRLPVLLDRIRPVGD
jgi:putative ABC transport system substrate-binding protein